MRNAIIRVTLDALPDALPLLRDEGLRIDHVTSDPWDEVCYVGISGDALPETFDGRTRFATVTISTESYGAQQLTRIAKIEPVEGSDVLDVLKTLLKVQQRENLRGMVEREEAKRTAANHRARILNADEVRAAEGLPPIYGP